MTHSRTRAALAIAAALLAACGAAGSPTGDAAGTDAHDAQIAPDGTSAMDTGPRADTGSSGADAATPPSAAWPAPGTTPGGNHPADDGACRFARATKYPIARTNGVPQGTCDFGPAADAMPQLFRDGYVVAPNEAFYRSADGQAGACGECLELTGPKGSMTVVVSDICDIACCDNCRGDVIAFDLEEQRWPELVDQAGGHVSVAWRWVPCPVSGNIEGYFTGGYQAGDRFRIVVFNHRVPVAKVEVMGPASGATGGQWTELVRTTDNFFDWTGRGDTGLPIQLRVTSTQGQVVTFPSLAALAADLRITADGQFDDVQHTPPATCSWPGPEPVVYDDQLQGILGLAWRDWGSYLLVNGMPDYASSANCHAGNACINVGQIQPWGSMQIGFPNKFPPGYFTAIEFWARTDGAAYDSVKFFYNGVDATGTAARSDLVPLALTGNWQMFHVDLAPIVANVAQMQVVQWSNQSNGMSPGIVVDDVRFVR